MKPAYRSVGNKKPAVRRVKMGSLCWSYAITRALLLMRALCPQCVQHVFMVISSNTVFVN